MYKKTNISENQINTDMDIDVDDKDFLFKCLTCHGNSQISYFL